MLTEKQFDILSLMAEHTEKLSQRELSKQTGYSLGSINSIITDLEENQFISDRKVLPKALQELEQYRVKRIIFIAAGVGTRMLPITLNTPKPLVRVKGQRLIDTMIDAALAANIEKIYIVRGYLSEQFDQLLYKYPFIKFIENPAYNESNNIASALCARYLLSNSYICEADILLKNPKLIRKYQYKSNYCGVPCETTDDWCLYETKGIISGVSVGGVNGYRMLGISYWTEADGKKLASCLEKAYNMPGGKERYWDSVPLTIFADEFKLSIRKCSFEDFDEIDTFAELKKLDGVYNV
jgi:CTP:phosphocholine cytidylyltransferase-like protein